MYTIIKMVKKVEDMFLLSLTTLQSTARLALLTFLAPFSILSSY